MISGKVTRKVTLATVEVRPQSLPHQEHGAGVFTPPSYTPIGYWLRTTPGEHKFPGIFALPAARRSSCRTPGAGRHGDGKRMVCYTITEKGWLKAKVARETPFTYFQTVAPRPQ